MKIYFLLAMLTISIAHGDLDERILEKSVAIEAQPTNATLYLERGDLFFLHEENEKAIEDFRASDHLNPNQKIIPYFLARSFFALNIVDSALVNLEKYFLDDESIKNIRAIQLHAKILSEKDEWCPASEKFDLVISMSPKTIPKYYLDAANAHLQCPEPESTTKAIDQILKGKYMLGPLYVFNQRLVKIYKKMGDLESAIVIQTEIVVTSNRKELPLFRRAKLWSESEKWDKATEDLKNALSAIDDLPDHVKNKNATVALRNEIISFKKQINNRNEK